MAITELFFELIQVSIGTRTCLSVTPSEKDWYKLYELAEKQALVGVCFAGIEKLNEQQQVPPMDLLMDWLGQTEYIKTRNEEVSRQCAELTERLKNNGSRSCILKGQGVARLYRVSNSFNGSEGFRDIGLLLRQSGDIDIWIEGNRDKALDWVRQQGAEVSFVDYVHSHASLFADTEVEVHSRPSWMYNRKSDKAFVDFWKAHQDEQFNHLDEEVGFCYPTVDFNLVYSLLHINRHIFEEGIGLRQLVDYFFILRASTKEEREDAIKVLRKMKLLRFAAGIMHIERVVLGLTDEYMPVAPDRKEGEFLLEDILIGGNFGKYDDRNVSTRLDERWKRGWYTLVHNVRYLTHYPSEVLSIPVWKFKHYFWRKKRGYI